MADAPVRQIMTDATGMDLAAEAERLAQEALKKKKAEEDALLKAYSDNSQSLYDTAKTNSTNLLTGAKTDVQGLYDQGYSDLQALTGEQSAAAMKDLVKQNESKLNAQGLLGGPSGALNEALATSAGKVRTDQLSQLEAYLGNKTNTLASVYGNTANNLSGLEQAYGNQSQGLLAGSLQNALSNTNQGAALTDKYATSGLEAALGTNKTVLEQAGQKSAIDEQAAKNAEAAAAKIAADKAALKNAQDAYDKQLYALEVSLYNQDTYHGPFKGPLDYSAQAIKQLGPRPA